MTKKYNPRDKFTAKESDFEILYMPKKNDKGNNKTERKTTTTKKK